MTVRCVSSATVIRGERRGAMFTVTKIEIVIVMTIITTVIPIMIMIIIMNADSDLVV